MVLHKEVDVPKLKEIFTSGRPELGEEEGWNSLFWNNHDGATDCVHFGDDGDYHVKSAKALAIVLHLMREPLISIKGKKSG